jgi:threonyl-tRNA synthetase
VRATLDVSNERIQAKIKVASEWKIPYLLVVGPRDEETNAVSVRPRGMQKDLGAFPLATFVEAVRHEIASRAGVGAIGVLNG